MGKALRIEWNIVVMMLAAFTGYIAEASTVAEGPAVSRQALDLLSEARGAAAVLVLVLLFAVAGGDDSRGGGPAP